MDMNLIFWIIACGVWLLVIVFFVGIAVISRMKGKKRKKQMQKKKPVPVTDTDDGEV